MASRDLGRAEAFATSLGIHRHYGDYRSLLDDKAIDAVYIALPNHLHAEWSIRCAEAGKHVLCEKPAALSGAEFEKVMAAVERADVFYMEGFMYRLHPLWARMREIIASGRIGSVRLLHASFCYDMGMKLDNIRQIPEVGGGALNDIGCYCLSFCRMLAGEEPSVLSATGSIGHESRVDEWAVASLRFPSGLSATFHCALRLAEPHRAIIYGDKGRIEIPSPWYPHKDKAELRVFDGRGEEVISVGDGIPRFAREAMRVAENLSARQCSELTLADSLGQARALERLRDDLYRSTNLG